MAIHQPTKTPSTTLLPETAARVTNLTRTVTDDKAGHVAIAFGATIHPTTTVYEVDTTGKPLAVYESADLPAFDVPLQQLAQLMGINVTLDDGTKTTIEELFANWEDQIIQGQLGLGGTITTPMVSLDPVAPAAAATPAASTETTSTASETSSTGTGTASRTSTEASTPTAS